MELQRDPFVKVGKVSEKKHSRMQNIRYEIKENKWKWLEYISTSGTSVYVCACVRACTHVYFRPVKQKLSLL